MFYVCVRNGAKRRRSILVMDAGATFLTVEPGGSAHTQFPFGSARAHAHGERIVSMRFLRFRQFVSWDWRRWVKPGEVYGHHNVEVIWEEGTPHLLVRGVSGTLAQR